MSIVRARNEYCARTTAWEPEFVAAAEHEPHRYRAFYTCLQATYLHLPIMHAIHAPLSWNAGHQQQHRGSFHVR